jgi:hypothetical protein
VGALAFNQPVQPHEVLVHLKTTCRCRRANQSLWIFGSSGSGRVVVATGTPDIFDNSDTVTKFVEAAGTAVLQNCEACPTEQERRSYAALSSLCSCLDVTGSICK